MADDDIILSDAEIGIIDMIKSVTELLLIIGVPPPALAESLELHRDAHRAAGRVDAALVVDMVRDYVTDPARAVRRQALRQFRQEPAKGSA